MVCAEFITGDWQKIRRRRCSLVLLWNKKLANYLWKTKNRSFFSLILLPIPFTLYENIFYSWNNVGLKYSFEPHFVNSLFHNIYSLTKNNKFNHNPILHLQPLFLY